MGPTSTSSRGGSRNGSAANSRTATPTAGRARARPEAIEAETEATAPAPPRKATRSATGALTRQTLKDTAQKLAVSSKVTSSTTRSSSSAAAGSGSGGGKGKSQTAAKAPTKTKTTANTTKTQKSSSTTQKPSTAAMSKLFASDDETTTHSVHKQLGIEQDHTEGGASAIMVDPFTQAATDKNAFVSAFQSQRKPSVLATANTTGSSSSSSSKKKSTDRKKPTAPSTKKTKAAAAAVVLAEDDDMPLVVVAKKSSAGQSTGDRRRAAAANRTEVGGVVRIKSLSANEKKACSCLREALHVLATEFATKSNRIPQLCHDVKRLIAPALAAATTTTPRLAPSSAALPVPAAEGTSSDALLPSSVGMNGEATSTEATAPVVAEQAVEAEANDAVDADDADGPVGGAAAAAGTTGQQGGPAVIPLPMCDISSVLQPVLDAVQTVRQAFADDIDACTDVPDEHLLRLIGASIGAALNELEGFVPPLPYVPDAKARRLRMARVEAGRAAREKARAKTLAREKELAERHEAKAREEAIAKAARGQGPEDTTLDHPQELAGVAYAPLPLFQPELFEQALRVWSFITSLPQRVRVAQMPLSTFLSALQDDNEKGTILRDVIRGLIEASGGEDIVATGRGRVDGWFKGALQFMLDRLDAAVEEAALASTTKGAILLKKRKKKTREQDKKKEGGTRLGVRLRSNRTYAPSESDEDEDEDEDEDDDDEDEDEDDESSGSDEEEDEEASEERPEQTAVAGGSDTTEGASAMMMVQAGGGDDDDHAEKKKTQPRPETTRQRARREALESQAELRKLHEAYSKPRHCSWLNLDVRERLSILVFLQQCALRSPKVAKDAADVEQRLRGDLARLVAKNKTRKEEMDKKSKELMKKLRDAAKRNQAAAKRTTAGKKRSNGAAPSGKKVNAGSDSDDDDDDKEDKARNDGDADGSGKQADGAAAEEAVLRATMHKLVSKVAKDAEEAFVDLRWRWDTENKGTRIVPLGQDRLRRIVWYLPQEARLVLQTVPGRTDVDEVARTAAHREQWGAALSSTTDPTTPTTATANAASFGSSTTTNGGASLKTTTPVLLDDEDEDEESMAARRRKRRAAEAEEAAASAAATAKVDARKGLEFLSEEDISAAASQLRWGYVAYADLATFVESLDPRGRREGPLRRAIEPLIPYVAKLDRMPPRRTSRHNAQDFGYFNRLRSESFW